MSLQKIFASVLLVGGLALVGGAVVLSMNGESDGVPEKATMPVEADLQVRLETPADALIAPKPIDIVKTEAVWRDWMAQNGVTQSSLAIGRDGTILHSAAQRRSPDAAYPMASLSKAITGMCLNQLLMNSPYSWRSTLADLSPEFAKMNFTPDAKMADLTLAQIATHTSGLPTTLEYGAMSIRSSNLSSQPTMAKAALKEPVNFGPRGSFVYSNANYAILGFLIEAMTGEPYGDHCKTSIMIPAGAMQAGVMGRMSYAAGYGGWSVSVEDYARFAMHWFDPVQQWMQTPENFGYDKSVHYGMGVKVHSTQRGTFVRHNGRWSHTNSRKPNIGSLFFVREDGTTVVVNWDGSLDFDLYKQLRQALRKAL